MKNLAPEVNRRASIVVAILIAASTTLLYARIIQHEFINYDDPQLIASNTHVLQGLTRESVWWAVTTLDFANWMPITRLSYIVVVELFGPNPTPQLLANLLVHVLTVLILYTVLLRFTGRLWPSALVAMLFALHPLQVESVAWASERKGLLSAFFWMLTLWAYFRYVSAPNAIRYINVAFAFALGLLCKPMGVTLPFVLLLLDFWPLKRFGKFSSEPSLRLIVEKIPLIALSIAVSILAIVAQRNAGAMGSLEFIPLFDRVLNAMAAHAIYLRQTLLPFGLAIFYPLLPDATLVRTAIAGAILLTAGTALAAATIKRAPYILVGWLWYLGTLVPVIGLVQVGHQSHADRYTYIPLIGLFVILSWALADLVADRPRWKRIVATVTILALVALGVRTWNQLSHWNNSESLFAHALQVTDNNPVAHGSYGQALLESGDIEDAILHFTEAIRIKPNHYVDHYNLGLAYLQQQEPTLASKHLRDALALWPGHVPSHIRLGEIYLDQKDHTRAANEYNAVLEIEANHLPARVNLAIALARQGNLQNAERQFTLALEQDNESIDALYNYALLLLLKEEDGRAADLFSRVLEINPYHEDARMHLNTLGQDKRTQD